jgi:NADH:ubiquinone oxidoreductase subunit 6 (subunit J)
MLNHKLTSNEIVVYGGAFLMIAGIILLFITGLSIEEQRKENPFYHEVAGSMCVCPLLFMIFLGLMLIILNINTQKTSKLTIPNYICPRCKHQLIWVDLYSRYYCYYCRIYY